jgi:hypothetical protein
MSNTILRKILNDYFLFDRKTTKNIIFFIETKHKSRNILPLLETKVRKLELAKNHSNLMIISYI